MSHFTVMVIGDDPETQLAPYHEYECTGVDDEYVIDVDKTDEVNAWLEEAIWCGVNNEGKLDYQYKKETCEKEDYTEIREVTQREYAVLQGENEEQAVDDWFGYDKNEEGKYFQHTNPNSKWDWYQIGGRWSGFFKVKNPGESMLGEKSWANADAELSQEHADVTNKGNIDIVAMEDEARKEATERFDHLEAAIGDIAPMSWTQVRTDIVDIQKGTIDDARAFYRESDFNQAIKKYEKANDVHIDGFMSNPYDDYHLHLPLNQARVKYVETAVMNIVTPYAFVKNGQWVERGEMGWWGMASNEKDKDEWLSQFYKMFKELPDDTLLTVVDCHI